MDYYIVRIYRRDGQAGQNLTGLVETVGRGGAQVFNNPDELWNILRGQGGPQGLEELMHDKKNNNIGKRSKE